MILYLNNYGFVLIIDIKEIVKKKFLWLLMDVLRIICWSFCVKEVLMRIFIMYFL